MDMKKANKIKKRGIQKILQNPLLTRFLFQRHFFFFKRNNQQEKQEKIEEKKIQTRILFIETSSLIFNLEISQSLIIKCILVSLMGIHDNF